MAARHRSATENSVIAAASIDGVNPFSTATGDLLLAVVYVEGGTGTSVTPPAGWTSEKRVDDGTVIGMEVFSKIAASEPATYTFTLGAAVDAAIHVIAVVDADQLDAVGMTSALASPESTDLPAPGLVAPEADTLIYAAWMVNSSATSIVIPSGMVEVHADPGNGSAVLSAYETVGEGATGVRGATYATNVRSVAVMLAVNNTRRTVEQRAALVLDDAANSGALVLR
jgi:hypothetical protein